MVGEETPGIESEMDVHINGHPWENEVEYHSFVYTYFIQDYFHAHTIEINTCILCN